MQSIQGPRDEILVAFFSKHLKTADSAEKDLVAAVAAQDAEAVRAALAAVQPDAVRRLQGPGDFTLLHMASADKSLYATAHTALSLMMGGFYHQQRLWGTQVTGEFLFLFCSAVGMQYQQQVVLVSMWLKPNCDVCIDCCLTGLIAVTPHN